MSTTAGKTGPTATRGPTPALLSTNRHADVDQAERTRMEHERSSPHDFPAGRRKALFELARAAIERHRDALTTSPVAEAATPTEIRR